MKKKQAISFWQNLQEPRSSRTPKKTLAFPLINKLPKAQPQQNILIQFQSQRSRPKQDQDTGVFTAKMNELPGLNIIEYNLFRSNLQYQRRKSPKDIKQPRKKNNSVKIVLNHQIQMEKEHLFTQPDETNTMEIKIQSISAIRSRNNTEIIITQRRRQSIESKKQKTIKSERTFCSSQITSLKKNPNLLPQVEKKNQIALLPIVFKAAQSKIDAQGQSKRKRLRLISELLNGQFAPWNTTPNNEEAESICQY